MAAGKPILATQLPSVTEVLIDGKNAVLVEPDNPQAIAQGIRHIMADKEFRCRISAQAWQDVRAYTWEERAQKIVYFIGANMPALKQ